MASLPADLAEWRRALTEEGDGESLDPTTAQTIAPKLMAEIEALCAEAARARAEAPRVAVTQRQWAASLPACDPQRVGPPLVLRPLRRVLALPARDDREPVSVLALG